MRQNELQSLGEFDSFTILNAVIPQNEDYRCFHRKSREYLTRV